MTKTNPEFEHSELGPSTKAAAQRIIFPLDYPTQGEAVKAIQLLRNFVGQFKVGLQTINGQFAANLVKVAHALGRATSWDGKWHDIPNTVKGAAEQVAALRMVKWCNVHASAGRKSIEAAVQTCHAAPQPLMVYGVTVLTSIDETECQSSIFGSRRTDKVVQFARMLLDLGADGIICSPQELEALGEIKELNCLRKVTPSVRPLWAPSDDQAAILTPGEAIRAGADELVIGRPISNPPESIYDNLSDHQFEKSTPLQIHAAVLIAAEIAAAINTRRAAGTWKED